MNKMLPNLAYQKKINGFDFGYEKLNRLDLKCKKLNHFSQTHFSKGWLKKPIMSGKHQSWLIERCSLTLRLQKKYADFAVKPLFNQLAKPLPDEVAPLAISAHHHALIREVFLVGNQVPVVFAHSVLPREILRGGWFGLAHLGNKPLGAVLFSNPKVQRTTLGFKKLSPQHALYQHAVKHLSYSSKVKPIYLWARRSIFSLNYANIMVTEVFLPALFGK